MRGEQGSGAHLVHEEQLVVDLDAQVVGLDNELVLGTLAVARQVCIRVFAVVLDVLHTRSRISLATRPDACRLQSSL